MNWRYQSKDLVTGHGGSRHGSIGMIWNYKIKELTHVLVGHKKRVTGLKVNPMN